MNKEIHHTRINPDRPPRSRPCVVFSFTITHGKIIEINLLADPDLLPQLINILYHTTDTNNP
ncbi:MAG TPA: hypothetical protein VIY29_26065 [Ktedonobacteraceae bacterium]